MTNNNDRNEDYEEEFNRMARLMEQQARQEGERSVEKFKDMDTTTSSPSYSLGILTVVVSMFFVATVGIFGDKFVVPVDDPTAPSNCDNDSLPGLSMLIHC